MSLVTMLIWVVAIWLVVWFVSNRFVHWFCTYPPNHWTDGDFSDTRVICELVDKGPGPKVEAVYLLERYPFLVSSMIQFLGMPIMAAIFFKVEVSMQIEKVKHRMFMWRMEKKLRKLIEQGKKLGIGDELLQAMSRAAGDAPQKEKTG